jgi:putative Ca2+/H+ antiporter (TMEM165/GDT1 family)
VFGVTLGGILGHGLCTGIAVIGGRLIAQRISVRTGERAAVHTQFLFYTVTLIGGVVFILFALSALFISPENS